MKNKTDIHPEKKGAAGIAARDAAEDGEPRPYNVDNFKQIGVLDAWEKY
jgi:hypothetical protein